MRPLLYSLCVICFVTLSPSFVSASEVKKEYGCGEFCVQILCAFYHISGHVRA
jgi:hypothetical protein